MGADLGAFLWAVQNSKKIKTYEAEWSKYGRAAGPIRNRRMIEEGKPNLVVAFPGGAGTANMTKLAREAGIKVIQVE
jgi:hypothetical protein